jgi:hypothetical protein
MYVQLDASRRCSGLTRITGPRWDDYASVQAQAKMGASTGPATPPAPPPFPPEKKKCYFFYLRLQPVLTGWDVAAVDLRRFHEGAHLLHSVAR